MFDDMLDCNTDRWIMFLWNHWMLYEQHNNIIFSQLADFESLEQYRAHLVISLKKNCINDLPSSSLFTSTNVLSGDVRISGRASNFGGSVSEADEYDNNGCRSELIVLP